MSGQLRLTDRFYPDIKNGELIQVRREKKNYSWPLESLRKVESYLNSLDIPAICNSVREVKDEEAARIWKELTAHKTPGVYKIDLAMCRCENLQELTENIAVSIITSSPPEHRTNLLNEMQSFLDGAKLEDVSTYFLIVKKINPADRLPVLRKLHTLLNADPFETLKEDTIDMLYDIPAMDWEEVLTLIKQLTESEDLLNIYGILLDCEGSEQLALLRHAAYWNSLIRNPIKVVDILNEIIENNEEDEISLDNSLAETFIEDIHVDLPLLASRPPLLHYLISNYSWKIDETLKTYNIASSPSEIQRQFIPFFKPAGIVELISQIPDEPDPAILANLIRLKTEITQHPRRRELTIGTASHDLFPTLPYDKLSIIAKNRPDLVLPYLHKLDHNELAAIVPFLSTETLMNLIFKPDGSIAIPIQTLANWIRFARLDFKKVLLERLPFNRITLEEEFSLIKKAFGEGDTDPVLEQQLLQKQPVSKQESKKTEIPDEYYDPLTGAIMTHPILLPGGISVDQSTFENPEYFPREGDKALNPFTKSRCLVSDCKVNEELKKAIDQFFSKNLP